MIHEQAQGLKGGCNSPFCQQNVDFDLRVPLFLTSFVLDCSAFWHGSHKSWKIISYNLKILLSHTVFQGASSFHFYNRACPFFIIQVWLMCRVSLCLPFMNLNWVSRQPFGVYLKDLLTWYMVVDGHFFCDQTCDLSVIGSSLKLLGHPAHVIIILPVTLEFHLLPWISLNITLHNAMNRCKEQNISLSCLCTQFLL